MPLHSHNDMLTKNNNDLARSRKTRASFRYLKRSSRPMVGRWLAGAKAASTRMDKMVAGRVTESYLGLFLKSRHDDGSRATAIAKIGALEVRLVEMQTVNVCESLWVELYDRDRQIGVDSCKCTDLDEAIDANSAPDRSSEATQQRGRGPCVRSDRTFAIGLARVSLWKCWPQRRSEKKGMSIPSMQRRPCG